MAGTGDGDMADIVLLFEVYYPPRFHVAAGARGCVQSPVHSDCCQRYVYVDLSCTFVERHVVCQTCVCSSLKAQFHYAIWFEAGSKLVADLKRAEIWPII